MRAVNVLIGQDKKSSEVIKIGQEKRAVNELIEQEKRAANVIIEQAKITVNE
jgi:hypothetical protein